MISIKLDRSSPQTTNLDYDSMANLPATDSCRKNNP